MNPTADKIVDVLGYKEGDMGDAMECIQRLAIVITKASYVISSGQPFRNSKIVCNFKYQHSTRFSCFKTFII